MPRTGKTTITLAVGFVWQSMFSVLDSVTFGHSVKFIVPLPIPLIATRTTHKHTRL